MLIIFEILPIKSREKNESDLADALKLMTLAKRARPTGPYIRKMVDEWTARLKRR